jgi:hypothetical protein
MGRHRQSRIATAKQSRPRQTNAIAESRHAWIRHDWIWCLPLLLSAWWLSFNSLRNADLWWHLAAGRWIVEHRSLPRMDPFSFSAQGRAWLNHEWFADVLMYLWASIGGLESLVYWLWLILLATYFLLFQLCRTHGGSPLFSLLGVSVAVATSAPFFEIRPHLYSLFFYVVILWLLLLSKPRLRLMLPVIFLLWANLHGGFIFGLLAAATVLVTRLVVSTAPQLRSGGSVHSALASRRTDVLVVVASATACLVNPYGFKAFEPALRYAFDSSSPFRALKEWLPPFSKEGVSSPLFPWLIALFLIACLILLLSPQGRRMESEIRWSIVALGGLTLLMALRSGRFIPLFSVSACLPISLLLAAWLGRPRDRRGELRWLVLQRVIPLLLAAVCLAMLTRYPVSSRAFGHLTSLESFPVDTLDFLTVNRLSGKMFAYYGWGGYVQYRADARMKVYIDSRADTVYSGETFDDYRRVQYMLPGWLEVVESSDADYFLWLNMKTPQVHQIGQVQILLATGRWRKVHEDFVSVLLARTTAPLPQTLPARPSAYRELALGGFAMRAGDKRGAETHLRAALSLDDNSLAACRNLALVLAWQDRFAEAWAQQVRCRRIFPEKEREDELRSFIEDRRRRATL